MPRLLVVHHTPSPNLQAVLEAVRQGAAMVEEGEVFARPGLSPRAADPLAGGGAPLGAPVYTRALSRAL